MNFNDATFLTAMVGLLAAATALVWKLNKYLDSRIRVSEAQAKAAEAQAKTAEAEAEYREADLQLRGMQLEIDKRKLLEMRRSRKVQQQACGVADVPGEDDTGQYHLEEHELVWNREEPRRRDEHEAPPERGRGGPLPRPPKGERGVLGPMHSPIAMWG